MSAEDMRPVVSPRRAALGHVHAVDRRGNAGPEASTTVKVDQTPPAIDVTSPPTANRYLAVTEVGVALRFGAIDPLSGLEYLDARLFDWEGGGGIVRDGHVIDAPGIYRSTSSPEIALET